ncbi:MAG: M23 family metallopeptidase [Tenacibaculum sp.]
MRLTFFTLILLLLGLLSFSQSPYPKNYFGMPLEIPLSLSGTFGELRNNHFHSGLDIKTSNKQGLPVYATADGYVSRIKIGQYGFGKTLYLSHPNGYTTVYAHLQKFTNSVQKYVKKVQYEKEKYNIGNLFLKSGVFTVKKGDLIAYSGNTGSTKGPHLHFEIRDTKTKKVINPLHFGFAVKDTIIPSVQKLLAYPLSPDASVNYFAKKAVLELKQVRAGKYTTKVINASGIIGFGVEVFDKLNGEPNKNGIYSLEMKVNGNRVYYHVVTSFSFAESKYINLLIDYPYYKKYKTRVQKTHKVAASKLSLYQDLINNGKIEIKEKHNYLVEIICSDFNKNKTRITIPVKGVKSNMHFKQIDTTQYKIKASAFNKFTIKNMSVAFPKNSFYEDCFIQLSFKNGLAKIHNPSIPLNKKYTLSFEISHLSEKQKQQLYIANVDNQKYTRYIASKKKNNKIYAAVNSLGSYTLLYDDEKPEIKPVNFSNKQWVSKNKTLKVSIKDNQAGIDNYRATINGKWILMEYNHKKGVLTYDFEDKKLIGSSHIFKIVVSDKVGNINSLSINFFKKF